jgi:hypothetical protein
MITKLITSKNDNMNKLCRCYDFFLLKGGSANRKILFLSFERGCTPVAESKRLTRWT